MGNFIDNYTESRVREANNMLEKLEADLEEQNKLLRQILDKLN